MKLDDFDIVLNHGNLPDCYARIYVGNTIVWEPTADMVPVTGSTLVDGEYYVLFNPDQWCIASRPTSAGTFDDGINASYPAIGQYQQQPYGGPTAIGISGTTNVLDGYKIFQAENGKLKDIASGLYLALGSGTGTKVSTADSTGTTLTLVNHGGCVYLQATGTNYVLGYQKVGSTLYNSAWYDGSPGCEPDEYFYVYHLE